MNSLSKTLNIFLWLGLDWTHQPLKYATTFFKWMFANNRCFVWYMYLYLKKYVYNKNIGTCIYGYLIYLLVLLLLLGFFLNWWVWILYWHSPVNWNCHIVNCYIRQYIKTAMFIILYLRTSSKCTAKLTIYHILILLHTPTKKIHYLTIMEAEKYILTWSSV